MKKIAGYICLVLSFAVWGVIALLPFIDISKGEVAAATTFLIISGEVLFLVSIALLGKDAWEHIKAMFKRNK
ncbi:MAG: transporter suffix domain-containing protein [Xanthomonadales bacterium]|nr:transporter suffix domain-containing protein [Xanthomonadales bacterium]MCB1593379.1 transporter suffix domain-containing protein [Xanthomonadales bacterium]MCB1603857.1 transporter suffix domain-containing protein [Xanthomonadales bacterium]